MIFQALIAVFAFDSVSTYCGVSTGWLQEFNPLVARLIEIIGLAPAMVAIFLFKGGLAFYLTRHRQRWAVLSTYGLFVFYVTMLTVTWARFFL